jgi:hypothetical protein
VSTVYVGVTFEVHPAEMEKNTLAMPFNGNFDGAVIPNAIKEIGVSDSREGAFRAKWYEYLPVEAGRASEAPLGTRAPKIEGKRPYTIKVHPLGPLKLGLRMLGTRDRCSTHTLL